MVWTDEKTFTEIDGRAFPPPQASLPTATNAAKAASVPTEGRRFFDPMIDLPFPPKQTPVNPSDNCVPTERCCLLQTMQKLPAYYLWHSTPRQKEEQRQSLIDFAGTAT